MDPISSQKKEQQKESAPASAEVVRERERGIETPAVVETVEAIVEAEPVIESVESTEQESTQLEEQTVVEPVMQKVSHAQHVVPKKNKFEFEIEDVLQEDLQDLYLSMNPEQRKAFKKKGEETISLIHQLVRAAHINTKKIFQLIRSWLHMIPGVNRFFLEQEAKIKTDKVLLVTEEEKRRGSTDLL